MKIFYSWQSDLSAKNTKDFIQKVIKMVIKELYQDQNIDMLEFDRDTQNVPGTPEIPSTILKKIADLSYVHKKEGKGIPNPNVLLEYGFALQCLGDARIIGIMNKYYGNEDIIPFDLKHRRHPLSFFLSENMENHNKEEKNLVKDLKNAIKLILEMGPAYKSRFIEDNTKKRTPLYPKNFKRLMMQQNMSEAQFAEEYKNYVLSYKNFIDTLKELPKACLSFLMLCVDRSKDDSVLTSEIEKCFGTLTPDQIKQIFLICHQKNLIFNDEIDIHDFQNCSAFTLASIKPHPWSIWQEIKDFALHEKINLSTFMEDLDFSSMDGLEPFPAPQSSGF